jgi:DnaJ domain
LPVDFTYYDILGVERSATPDEIRAAYRAAVLKYHPDVNTAPNAQRLTAMLNDAYEILSDPERRRAYDQELARGVPTTETGESADEVWELFTCDRCGKVDPHLRFAMFFRVWSIIFYTRMSGAGGVLCPSCRSWFATTTALFSAFLGPWGFPWGLIYTGRALIAAARGGELKKLENAQLLRHLGLAFVQRGYLNESRTAFNDSLRFERNPAVVSMLQEPEYASASLLPQGGWLPGQTVGVLSFAIPIVLLFVVFSIIGASESPAPNSSTGMNTTASDSGAATTSESATTSDATPCPSRQVPRAWTRPSN